MTTINLLDNATVKDGYRYNGTNEDGSPKEQAWAYNCIITMKVNSNTECTIIDSNNIIKIKAVYFFNDNSYINSISSVYGISKFTTPTNCNNFRISPFATWSTIQSNNIRIECESSSTTTPDTTPDTPIENNCSELQTTIDSLTIENSNLRTQIDSLTTENSNLKTQITTLNAKISELESSTCNESDIESLEIKITNLRRDMNILLNNM